MSRTGRSNVEHETASKIKAAVDNMPQGVADALNKVREMNEAKKDTIEDKAIPEGLKDLFLFGKLTDEVVLGNYKFKISTLTAKQQKEILKKLIPLSNEDKFLHVKTLTLAEAIVSVNESPLESLYTGDTTGLSSYEIKKEILSELQTIVIDKIFQKYEDLLKKSNSMFEDGGLGDSVKN